MSDTAKWTLYSLGIAVLVAFLLFMRTQLPDDLRSYAAPGFGQLNAKQLSRDSYEVAPEMLAVIYRAFSETDEGVIYDSLAEVAAGPALEALYLERLGAMAGGGLDQSDQQLHEMELINLTSQGSGATVRWDAKWRVVGTVGHATHLHVRGNTYAANLTLEPVDGAWRMTAFELTDVDRSDTGTIVETVSN